MSKVSGTRHSIERVSKLVHRRTAWFCKLSFTETLQHPLVHEWPTAAFRPPQKIWAVQPESQWYAKIEALAIWPFKGVFWPVIWSNGPWTSSFQDHWPLNNMDLNCMDSLIHGFFFSANTLEKFSEICHNLKKITKPRNEKKIKKKVCHECIKYLQILVYPHIGIRWVIFNIKLILCLFLYCFITLLSKNYITIQFISLSNNWRNCELVYHHR